MILHTWNQESNMITQHKLIHKFRLGQTVYMIVDQVIMRIIITCHAFSVMKVAQNVIMMEIALDA